MRTGGLSAGKQGVRVGSSQRRLRDEMSLNQKPVLGRPGELDCHREWLQARCEFPRPVSEAVGLRIAAELFEVKRRHERVSARTVARGVGIGHVYIG